MAEKVTVRTQPEDTRPQVRFVVLTQTTTDVRKHLNVADAPELIAWESAPRSTGIVQPVERKGTHSTVFVPVVLNPGPLRPKRDPTRIQGGIRRRHHLRRTLPSSPAPADQHRRHHHADKSDHSTTRDPSPRDRATRQRKRYCRSPDLTSGSDTEDDRTEAGTHETCARHHSPSAVRRHQNREDRTQ